MLLIHSYPEGRVTRHLTQFLQSSAKTVETLCLLKRIFRSRTSLFSFTPPPHFNVVVATKSIRQSNILNIEKGEGESIGFNTISLKTREKAQIMVTF